MALNVDAVLDGIVSNALQLGIFEKVNTHEPKSAPVGRGLTLAIWVQTIRPAPADSSILNTSALVVFNMRITQSMLTEPQDSIDPSLMKAVDTLLTQYSFAFTLAGSVRNIDLLGANGIELAAEAGYYDVGGKFFRGMTITLPVIINDVWTQGP